MRFDETLSQFAALWAQAKQGFVTALPNIVMALAIFAAGWGLAWTLRRLMLGAFRRFACSGRPLPPGHTRE